MFRETIRNFIHEALRAVQEENRAADSAIPNFSVSAPEIVAHGDYATNAAIIAARLLKKNPIDLAGEIAATLKKRHTDFFSKIEVAPPGFINCTVANEVLLRELNGILKNPETWGSSDIGAGKTVVVDYFQLNIAKRPHVGHIRSAILGDAIKRMLLSQGYRAVSDTHIGDWGTQFGILLLAWKEHGERKEDIERADDPFDALEKLYIEENKRIENDPARRDQAKQEFANLEQGDTENRKIWEWMVDISMKKLEESAYRLGLLQFDEHKGESSYEEAMPPIAKLALKKNVAKKEEDGAVIVDLESEGLDQAVLMKSDGASTYLLRDLATIQYRKEHWKFWRNLYFVDVRQSHHFKQLFRVAELLGLEGVGESEHVEYGFMSLPEGALSSRKGTAISLDMVMNEAVNRARDVIQAKNPDLANAEGVAQAVGIGALKYFDLSHYRKSDVVFRWEEALSFDGDTGPYLQYTHARLKSILRKINTEAASKLKVSNEAIMDDLEHRLLVWLMRLPEGVEDALADFTPNILAGYLYNLAKLANEFYHSHPVMQEEDESKRKFRVALVSGIALTLAKGLDLLGIAAPEEM